MLGGGMRQAGIIAAAGIVALETMTKRLADDHARARKMFDALRETRGVILDEGSATNMVFFDLAEDVPMNAAQLAEETKKRGVLISALAPRRLRLTTHYWIDDAGAEQAVQVLANVLESVS